MNRAKTCRGLGLGVSSIFIRNQFCSGSARSANKLAQRRCLTGHQRFGEVRPDCLEKKMKIRLSIQIDKLVLFSYMYQIDRFRFFVLQPRGRYQLNARSTLSKA